MEWVIRVTVVGLVGTSITFYVDVSYTLKLPHVIALLFFEVTNGYGATVGYIIGLTLRILLGENVVGLNVVLHLPGCTLEDGVYVYVVLE